MQAASIYSTIANDGVRVEPRLVAGTTAPDGTYTPAAAPKRIRVVSAKTAAEVRRMLESVVSEQGTAPMAQIAGYRVAGKTGTANRVSDVCHCYSGYTASFIGMAPADDPGSWSRSPCRTRATATSVGGSPAPSSSRSWSSRSRRCKVPPSPTPARPFPVYAR